MRLWLSSRVDTFLEERLVLDSQVGTAKNSVRDAKSRLKVPLVVDGWRTSNTEVVPQDGLQSGRKVAPFVGAAPDRGATVSPTSSNALGARASVQRHQHLDMRMHNSTHVRPVIFA